MRKFFRELLMTFVLAVVIFLLLHATIQTTLVKYSCMEPGIEEGQRLLVLSEWVAYNTREPQRGDVIVFNPPFPSDTPYIKRVIGLPGESVEIKQGTVYVKKNGVVYTLNEPYVTDPAYNHYQRGPIPEGEYFVLGDNRNNSSDSRNGWTVKQSDIIGKAWLSIWPLDKWGPVSNNLEQEVSAVTP